MAGLLRKKSRLELLKRRYSDLMRRSFKLALEDKEESDRVNKRAKKIFDEIKYLRLQADK